MADDDIICLSSDDEGTTRELLPKKSKFHGQSLMKTEGTLLVNQGRNLKRKDSQNLSKISLVCAKKSKIESNGSIPEILITSPQKQTNQESILTPQIHDLQSVDNKVDTGKCLNNSDAMVHKTLSPGNSSPTKNISPSAKSSTGDFESSSKHQGLKIRNDLKNVSNSGDVHSSSYCQKAYKNKHSVKEVRNIFAKSKQTNHTKSSIPTTAQEVEKISQCIEIPEDAENQKKSNSLKITENTNIFPSSKNGQSNAERLKLEAESIVTVETTNVDSNVAADNRSTESESIRRSSDSDQILTGITDKPSTPKTNDDSSRPPRAVHSNHNLPITSIKNKTDKTPCTTTKISLKSNDIAKSPPTCSKLEEVQIVEMIEKPKSTNKSSSGALKISSTIISKASASPSKLTPTKSSKQHGENSSHRKNSNSDICNTSDIKISHKIDNPTVHSTKKDGKCDDGATDQSKSSKPVTLRRITTQKVPVTNKNDKQKYSDSTSNVSDELKGARESLTSKSFEPTPGCSQTPDSSLAKGTKSVKRKLSLEATSIEEPSTNPTNVQIAEKLGTPIGDETPEFVKPRLVVKTKEPVDQDKPDTFAMFLGLCLQTDRTSAMEKIVAKLKHHYDLMCPKYAKSRSFQNVLNEKRDKIINTGKVYYFISQVTEEMKRRKIRGATLKKNSGDTNDEAKANTADEVESYKENGEENYAECKRLEAKLRTIDKAMNQCQKRIRELEEAEVDFEDENNSHYIKLDRYKDKMIELYTKMCEYTKEHADAGRAYLRPKHLRVTQIPAIDLAINSFINSKLSYNRKKGMKGRSFVDGLIFPDYVDILECVGKVNKEQDLGLSKRRQQKLAEEAFTQLGKHLQTARQQDYWDTFAMELEGGEDPATTDAELSKKLAENQIIAEKRTKEIFEEFVRKQEEGKVPSSESEVSSEGEDDDDENNENENEERNSSHSNESGVEMSDDDDEQTDPETEKDNEDDNVNTVETVPEASRLKDSPIKKVDAKVPDAQTDNDETTANGIHPTSKKKIDEAVKTSKSKAAENSIEDKPIAIEANLAEDDTNDVNEPVVEPAQQHQQPLRIRSFAKPPSSWISSQEASKSVTNENISRNTETIDLSDDESASPTKTAVRNIPIAPTMESAINSAITNDCVTKGSSNIVDWPTVRVSLNESLSPIKVCKKKIGETSVANQILKQSSILSFLKSGENRRTSQSQSRRLDTIRNKTSQISRQPNVVSSTTIAKVLQGSRQAQKIRVSTSTTNPVNVRLQVTTTKTPQLIRAQTNNMKSAQTADPPVLQLAKGKCIAGPTMLGNRPVQTTSNNAPQMKMRIPHAGQVGRLSISQQLRPQLGQTLRVFPPGKTQILRFSNGESIRATSATFRRVDISQSQQQKTPVASLANLPNSRTPTITLNNPRFIRLPVVAPARSPDISQLRIEKIESAPKNSLGVTTHENSIRTIPEILIARASPVLKPRLNENVPTTQQTAGVKRRREKTIAISPNVEPPCKQ